MKKQVELSITHNGKDVVAYPYSKKEHVQFENGMNIDEFVGQDIATPTITHDTTAIKVGVGDSDVSGSVVDGTVNMTIKGQTYQNILPEPTLRNEMQGKSMQRLNEGYDNIEVVDGVSKSAILKGQTLVNIAKKQEKPFSHSADKVLQNNHLQLSHSLKANTTYTRYIHVSALDLGTTSNVVMYDALYGEDGSYSQYSYVVTSKGWIINTFTPKTTSINPYMINPDMNALSNGLIYIEIDKFMIIEGDYTNVDIPYFEGMQSVKMPVLQTIGKNLSPINSFTGIVTTVNDSLVAIDKLIKKNIVLNPNKTYICSTKCSNNTIVNNMKVLLTNIELPNNSIEGSSSHNLIYTWTVNNGGKQGSINTPFTGYKYAHITTGGSFPNQYATKGDAIEYYDIQLEEGSTPTTYEPYKSNILHTPEEVVLKGLGDVQDTLNVNTGEYVQRVKEVIYTGEEDGWSSSQMLETPNNISFYIPLDNHLDNTNNPTMRELVKDNLGFTNNCRSATVNEPSLDGKKGFSIHNNGNVYFTIPTSECANLDAWKSRLRTQPLVLQYPVKNPIIKTVDLSSHGNWEKVVLDGSENWLLESSFNHKSLIEFKYAVGNGIVSVISDRFTTGGNDVERIACTSWEIYIRILKSKVNTVDEFKQWLSQNPTTVWYQTTTTQDNSIREMLSFANGHLQVSSEAENSLLPFVQYEIPTKNSYHMDLMKTNTLYTMKAKTVSGTFTIDGTSYNVNANGTFTSPTSMTDKLLIMSNKTNKDVMLLEGNVIDKTIPYFKGIKSAFEGEDKIEVLSTGKNLFDMNRRYDNVTNAQATVIQNIDEITVSSAESGTYVNANFVLDKNFFKGKTVTGSCLYESDMKGIGTVQINYRDTSGKNYYQSIKTSKTFTFPDEFVGEVLLCVYANNTNTPQSNTVTVKNIQLELGTKSTTYDSYKSNVSKIPLLSPLRSLPNGVYDEIILNRENNNVKMIRRVGRVVLNGEEDWTHEDKWHRWYSSCMNMARANDYATMILNNSENLPVIKNNTILRDDTYGISGYELTSNYPNQNWIYIRPKNVSNTQALQSLLSQNPITVLYELATPIITEVDLEGFPYIYKDGHIFLNSDIAPTTQITYSINQAQQIESANENLQRHEKEISHLQKLIAQYIQVEYESTLLSLKI